MKLYGSGQNRILEMPVNPFIVGRYLLRVYDVASVGDPSYRDVSAVGQGQRAGIPPLQDSKVRRILSTMDYWGWGR